VRDGVVDGDRVAILGGSYGGFISSWAVTQTDRFAAAIPYAVVTNWLSFHNTTNIGEFDRLYLQAHPYDAPGEYVRPSPPPPPARDRSGRRRRGHAAAAGDRVLQRARRGGLRDGARGVPARGARVHRAGAPARLLAAHLRLARPPPVRVRPLRVGLQLPEVE